MFSVQGWTQPNIAPGTSIYYLYKLNVNDDNTALLIMGQRNVPCIYNPDEMMAVGFLYTTKFTAFVGELDGVKFLASVIMTNSTLVPDTERSTVYNFSSELFPIAGVPTAIIRSYENHGITGGVGTDKKYVIRDAHSINHYGYDPVPKGWMKMVVVGKYQDIGSTPGGVYTPFPTPKPWVYHANTSIRNFPKTEAEKTRKTAEWRIASTNSSDTDFIPLVNSADDYMVVNDKAIDVQRAFHFLHAGTLYWGFIDRLGESNYKNGIVEKVNSYIPRRDAAGKRLLGGSDLITTWPHTVTQAVDGLGAKVKIDVDTNGAFDYTLV